MTEDQKRMLEILKADSCGPSFACLREKFGQGWSRVSRQLVELGLARVDEGKNGRPSRVKALPTAWNV